MRGLGGVNVLMSVAESERGEMTFPDTPAGRTAAAFMRLLVTSADEIVFEEMDALYHPDLLARWPHEEDEIRRERWQRHQARGGGFQLAAVDVTSSFEIVPIIEYADGRRFKIALAIEEHPPHRIVDERWDQVFDFAVLVREATDADGPALAQLDRLAPIVQGEARVFFDRGDDYFADARLIEHVFVGLAEVDGAVAAVNWGAVHRPLIGGVERRLATALHLRVHPEHQGKGLWGAVNTKLWDFFQKHETETSYAFIHRDNEALQKDFSKNTKKWSFPVFRALLPCAAASGPATGRPATPADAAHIVEIINATHGREEMFVPYAVESLTARLERAPDLYSWDRVWIDGNAVVGVWPAGLRVMREEGDRRTESVRAFVLDYGFMTGAEAHLEGLLRAWCARHDELGTTELALFTWEGAPSYPIVKALGARLETFDLFLFNIPEPDGAAERGLYVDQIYI